MCEPLPCDCVGQRFFSCVLLNTNNGSNDLKKAFHTQ